ncbi:hypothetical protein [Magnetospirillum sp. SS-4]|uniref:hypothetical protein n=1 Tax=Magnetospirillum sp. SS-4 TaxID=2681465 RepID=UPI00137CA249|nr:hypothetical protein [Magnetospirillum sp. SS-4]CAA7614520.1 conserved hypothetical protein [Magnetospirillum sp. SS-4]
MLIGLDFDNTIAGYDRVFRDAALAAGFPGAARAATKKQVRDLVRLSPDADVAWQKLQAEVYARRMAEAELIEGVGDFLLECRRLGWDVAIVSHKTETAPHDPDQINLRQAALAWMDARGFFTGDGFGLKRPNIHFCSTRAEKLARIGQLRCAAFVDDLEEVFAEPGFPAGIERYLFHPAKPLPTGAFLAFSDWTSLGRHLFQRLG